MSKRVFRNAAALLIFADSHSCVLLKEAATLLFVTDTETVKSSKAWSEIRESNRLLEELLDSLASSVKPVKSNLEKVVDELNVTSLREELQEADVELDGSREVLVERLKTHRQAQDKRKENRNS